MSNGIDAQARRVRAAPYWPGPWLRRGIVADYRPVIGGPVARQVVVASDPFFTSAGIWCVVAAGVRGWLPCESLTRPVPWEQQAPSAEPEIAALGEALPVRERAGVRR